MLIINFVIKCLSYSDDNLLLFLGLIDLEAKKVYHITDM